MERPLLILHGWSDVAESMVPLAEALRAHLPHKVQHCSVADYLTLEDHITYDDLVEGFQQAWLAQGLPTGKHAVDVVVHSTGGLVIRDWLTRYYTPQTAPIKHLLMLAPANFGSYLAHKGRAFYGRMLKGMGHGRPFEVGSELLKGLELASPYTWNLAMRDCFVSDPFYGPGRTLCTVLVGMEGYQGLPSMTHDADSDGTVRWSCADLNPVHWSIDLSTNGHIDHIVRRSASGLCGFGLVAGVNHSSLVGKGQDFSQAHLAWMLRALTVSDDAFSGWCAELKAHHKSILNQNYKGGFQNTVIRVMDQYRKPIQDYFITFTSCGSDAHKLASLFHEQVHAATHVYANQPAYRCLYLHHKPLDQVSGDEDSLHINLQAYPSLDPENTQDVVGYLPLDEAHHTSIVIPADQLTDFLVPNRTMLMEVCLPRVHRQSVFQLKKLKTLEKEESES
jgi:hypothetical protein